MSPKLIKIIAVSFFVLLLAGIGIYLYVSSPVPKITACHDHINSGGSEECKPADLFLGTCFLTHDGPCHDN